VDKDFARLAASLDTASEAQRQYLDNIRLINEAERLGTDIGADYNDLRERLARSSREVTHPFETLLNQMEHERDLLRLTLENRERDVEVRKVEAEIAQRMGRDLLPAEVAQLAKAVDQRRALEQAIKSQKEAEKRLAEETREMERMFERTFMRIGDSIVDALARGEASAINFRDVMLAVIADITREAILRPALSELGKSASASFGGFFQQGIGGILAGLFHDGGSVGRGPVPVRMVNPAAFVNAPRFHGGDVLPGEVPIIARRGEYILTPDQMKAMQHSGRDGAKVRIENVNVYVPQNATVDQFRRSVPQLARDIRRSVDQAYT
jgi:hypothetical protein